MRNPQHGFDPPAAAKKQRVILVDLFAPKRHESLANQINCWQSIGEI
jgi:hypothetical protein